MFVAGTIAALIYIEWGWADDQMTRKMKVKTADDSYLDTDL